MMLRRVFAVTTVLLASTVLSGPANASGHSHETHKHEKHESHEHDKEHREHGAHVHGAGHLNLVMDGDKVEMEYVASGVDIVGFERPAVLKRDKEAIAKAIEVLKNGDGLVTFPKSAGCKMVSSDVDFAVNEEIHWHEDDHKDHDHKVEHKHDHGHDHDHKDADKAHSHEVHTEFQSHYAFTCAKPQNVKYLDVNVFKLFKSTEEIDVQAIGPWGQKAAELTAGNSRITFQ